MSDKWFCTSGCSLISYSFGLSFDTFADGYENILPQTFHACGNSFVIWLFMYAVLPGLWGEFSNEEVKNNLSHIFINFIPRASHLWFIYMLLGIYLIMPVLSPWLERVSRREEEVFLGIWLFTTLFWHAHEIFGDVFGECWWNPYPLFYYVSGYVGYVVMAHYIRKYLDWSTKRRYI